VFTEFITGSIGSRGSSVCAIERGHPYGRGGREFSRSLPFLPRAWIDEHMSLTLRERITRGGLIEGGAPLPRTAAISTGCCA